MSVTPLRQPESSPPEPPRVALVPTADDHLPGSRRLTARQAITAVLAALALLVVCDGNGIRRQGEKLDQGLERSVVLAVGHPAGWIADHLPFSSVVDQMTGWLSPDKDLGSTDGQFTAAAAAGSTRVDPAAFDPRALGLAAAPKPALRSLLVTGDSMSQPMDSELARSLTSAGVRTKRDPHFGTGISKSDLLDWGRYSQIQSRRDNADATVVFVGANEGFPMKTAGGTVKCCDVRWAAEYASRVRSMMQAYGRAGRGRVYWMLIPTTSDGTRNSIIRVVNTTIKLAAAAFGDQVRVVDLGAVLTPGGHYRSAMNVGGRMLVVRDPDGAHLNDVGGRLAADAVRRLLARDFDLGSS
jgi:uncharacterized protein